MDDFKKELYFKLLKEASKLGRKIIKLEKFCESSDYAKLSIWHRSYISSQSHAMRMYLDALQIRIKDIGIDIKE